MIACPQCQESYSDDNVRFCGRCGSQIPIPDSNGAADLRARAFDPMVGQVVGGRFRIIECIGEGAMGSVYRVEHIAIGKIAAIKMIHPLLTTDREIVRRFRREAEAVALLAHPNTVQVFDLGEEQGRVYMVMELIRGEDFARILKRDGPLSWSRAAPLFVQVCDALIAARDVGIVHRDLKPENILLSRTGDGSDIVKVLDFGLAKLRERDDLGGLTSQGSMIGTPFYMSPEQIRSEPLDHRSDVYSFGATMYRIVTGHHPFPGPTALAVLNQHLNDSPVPPSQRVPDCPWDPRVDALVLRCLEKDRERRFESFGELRAAVLATTGPASAALPPPPDEERRQVEVEAVTAPLSREDFDQFEQSLRRRRRMGLAIVPVVIGIAVGIGLALRPREPGPVTKEAEPNNVVEQSNMIATGIAVSGRIGKRLTLENSDRDYYRFHVPNGPVALRLQLTGLSGIDLHLALFDSTGSPIATRDNGGAGEEELIVNRRLGAGRYYVEVREVRRPEGATQEAAGEYSLRATYQPVAANEELEPNDLPSEAQPLALGRWIEGALDRANDRDLFHLPASHGTPIDGAVTAIPGVDVVLLIAPASGVVGELQHIPGARLFDAGGVGEPERFQAEHWPSGVSLIVAVARKDRPLRPHEKRQRLIGAADRYTLTVNEVGSK